MQMEEVWFAYQLYHPSIHYKDYHCILCFKESKWQDRYPQHSTQTLAEYETSIWDTQITHEIEENDICKVCADLLNRCIICDKYIIEHLVTDTHDMRFCSYGCRYEYKYGMYM